jgi:hypothetical protein
MMDKPSAGIPACPTCGGPMEPREIKGSGTVIVNGQQFRLPAWSVECVYCGYLDMGIAADTPEEAIWEWRGE